MTEYTSGIRAKLAETYGLEEQTRKSEQAILKAAETQLETVQAEITRLRPKIRLDARAGHQYEGLVKERGRLEQVIERSRHRQS